MGRSRFHRGGPLAFAAVVAVALSCGEIREDEMLCEEAVSHLEDCCPNIDPRRFNCVHDEGCGTQLFPVLEPQAADCVRNASCRDLQNKQICDGLRQLSYVPYPFEDRTAFTSEACR